MTALTLHSRIVFNRPFEVIGLAGMQPAGAYSVEMRRRPWWRALLKGAGPALPSMRICRNSGLAGKIRLMEVCQRDLGRALHRDRSAPNARSDAASIQ